MPVQMPEIGIVQQGAEKSQMPVVPDLVHIRHVSFNEFFCHRAASVYSEGPTRTTPGILRKEAYHCEAPRWHFSAASC